MQEIEINFTEVFENSIKNIVMGYLIEVGGQQLTSDVCSEVSIKIQESLIQFIKNHIIEI